MDTPSAYWIKYSELVEDLTRRGHGAAATALEEARPLGRGPRADAHRFLAALGALAEAHADGWAEMDREDLHWLSHQVSRYLAEGGAPFNVSGNYAVGDTVEADLELLLGQAKDAFLEAGMSEDPLRRRQLYARCVDLFARAREMGPVPHGLLRFEQAAKKRC